MEAFADTFVVQRSGLTSGKRAANETRVAQSASRRIRAVPLKAKLPSSHCAPRDLATLIAERAQQKFDGSRVLIGIAGVPGSGKTTTVTELVKLLEAKGLRTVTLPMDGFHFYRHQLDEFDHPEEAHKRRGAPFTFDVKRFLSVLSEVRNGEDEVLAPDFDHAKKDPDEGAIVISADVEVVVVEGNYLLLEEQSWSSVLSYLDASFFLDVDVETAMSRVAGRHVDQMGLTSDDAWFRVDSNDRPNAELVAASKGRADFLVQGNQIVEQSVS